MTTSLLKPELYSEDRSGDDDVVLNGGRCGCGHVFFPFQAYGCERCGSTELTSMRMRGRGTLVASVTVHMHARPERKAPFSVASIRLDDGPVLRALLTGPIEGLKPGCPVVARLVASGPEGARDLRFEAKR
jgi:uncharacterized OB-fold protein